MDETTRRAITAARLHYLQNMTMQQVATQLGVSPSKISRLLAWARRQGLVEVRIHDAEVAASELEARMLERFGVRTVVVATPTGTTEPERLDAVARVAAACLSQAVVHGTTLALAWGTTVRAIGGHLRPKAVRDVQIVQLNGSGNTHDVGVSYSTEILRRFASAFGAAVHPFPVPTFFDFEATKHQLWRERSIRRILDLQARADVLLYSIGAVQAGVPSHVYTGNYLDEHDLRALHDARVVGDVATVFFRADGSWRDIPINRRASGPDLSRYQGARSAICVVSGPAKAAGLLGALRGGYVGRLIADEATVEAVLALQP